MTVFWIFAALFSVAALLLVLPPLLVRRAPRSDTHRSANLAVYRDEARELDAELASGRISEAQHRLARRELEARLVVDLGDEETSAAAPRARRGTAVVAGILVPLGAIGLYLLVGTPQAIAPSGDHRAQAAVSGAADGAGLDGLVVRLAERLAQNPEDPDGWRLLARSYAALDRTADAVQAMATAVQRRPGDSGMLADYAELLARAQQGRFAGEPEAILARAMAADPQNIQAHALAGSAAFQRADYAAAVTHWEPLLERVPSESDAARALRESLAAARDRAR